VAREQFLFTSYRVFSEFVGEKTFAADGKPTAENRAAYFDLAFWSRRRLPPVARKI
jgi:hypothetical protein